MIFSLASDIGKVRKNNEDFIDSQIIYKDDDTKIGIFERFNVGNMQMMFPRDVSLGAGPEEIVNCRCSLRYSKD